MAAFLAAMAALGFAGAAVASKRGVQHMSTLGGFVISLPAGLAVAVLIAVFDPPEEIPLRALGFLALAGLFASGIGRVLVISGLRRLETSVYVPVQTSAHPLVGVLGGLLLFGERIGPLRAAGVAAVVAGIWILTRTGVSAEIAPAPAAPAAPARLDRARAAPLVALLFPVGAGLAFGAADITTKEAMLVMPHPAFAAAVSTSITSVVWLAIVRASPGIRKQIRFGDGKSWFVLYGVLSTLAMICAYAALERGDVSMVSPIIAAQPLAVLVLSALFLKRIEVVTARALLGGACVVAGAVLVSVS